MKYYFTLFLVFIFAFDSYCQITFEEVLTFEKKSFKEIQASLIEQYTIIKHEKEYRYCPLKKCNPPEYANDSCQWICSIPDYLDEVKSKYPLDNVKFKKSSNKNYEIILNLKSNFAQNYNSITKGATTFIYLSEKTMWQNNNCTNEMKETESRINIDIQFANLEDWQYFKTNIIKNATFQSTWQGSNDSPIELRYGIRRHQTEKGFWKGVFINMYESSSTYHVSIYFDSWGVE